MHFASENPQLRGQAFLEEVGPLLVAEDWDSLRGYLAERWPARTLAELLGRGSDEVSKAALIGLTLVGTMEQSPRIARLLRETADPLCAAAAERALWTLWFRAGGSKYGPELIAAVHLLCENHLEPALKRLDRLIRRAPDYAEAWNQRAITHFLLGRYERAGADCRQALALNPDHFGAMAGLGHSQAALGCPCRAMEAYHRALAMNPWMTDLRRAIEEIRSGAAGAMAQEAAGPPGTSRP